MLSTVINTSSVVLKAVMDEQTARGERYRMMPSDQFALKVMTSRDETLIALRTLAM